MTEGSSSSEKTRPESPVEVSAAIQVQKEALKKAEAEVRKQEKALQEMVEAEKRRREEDIKRAQEEKPRREDEEQRKEAWKRTVVTGLPEEGDTDTDIQELKRKGKRRRVSESGPAPKRRVGSNNNEDGREPFDPCVATALLFPFPRLTLSFQSPCVRCSSHGKLCLPRPTGPGRACEACMKAKTKCSFAGEHMMLPAGSTGSEVLKETINEVVASAFRKQNAVIRELITEFLGRSISGRPVQEDGERKVQEALQNWRQWGKSGSRYEHLPMIKEEMLRKMTRKLEGVRSTDEKIWSGAKGVKLTCEQAREDMAGSGAALGSMSAMENQSSEEDGDDSNEREVEEGI
jgi:hypothetical protein